MAFVCELTKETINLPMGCLQGGVLKNLSSRSISARERLGVVHQPDPLQASLRATERTPPAVPPPLLFVAKGLCIVYRQVFQVP